MNRSTHLVLAAMAAALALPAAVSARGFGGFRMGGGFEGGGFQGGGFQGGGSEGGSFGGQPFQINSFQAGGFGEGDVRGAGVGQPTLDAAGYAVPSWGGARIAPMGLPTDVGLHLAEGAIGGQLLNPPPTANVSSDPPLGRDVPASLGSTPESGTAGGAGSGGYAQDANTVPGLGTRYVSPTAMRATGQAVRRTLAANDVFTSPWYAANPGVWSPSKSDADVWAGATWNALHAWFGTDWESNAYDFGHSITYAGDSVLFQGQPFASAQAYAQAAAALAKQGQADVAADARWLPLGVFAMLGPGQNTAHSMVQLAIDKAGRVRGNSYTVADKKILPVRGAVDKQTQRIAWNVGDSQDLVFDTGLYNLTQSESPVLAHLGTDMTDQWLMVRLNGPTRTGK